MTTKKKIFLAVGIVIALPVLWYGFWGLKLYMGAKKQGLLERPEKRTYTGNSLENLKSIHTALMLYQDSEGALPEASGWMDAAWSRLQTADMEDEEARKKLQSSGAAAEDEFGFAFNDAASKKYTDDLPPATVLVFDSKNLAWNAHGKPDALAPNPPRDGGNKGITVAGNVVELK